MSEIHEIKCDLCCRRNFYLPELPAYPAGWMELQSREHPVMHFCSLDCLHTWAASPFAADTP